jgi:hypothetical protein
MKERFPFKKKCTAVLQAGGNALKIFPFPGNGVP